MARTIRARFSKGVIEPLEKVSLDEGEEITVTILELPEETTEEDSLDAAFGGWSDLIDCEKLKENIYTDRLISTRAKVEL